MIALHSDFQDYNFLDYHEKVIDGFYDIFGPSMESSRQGKMPSLEDLQTGIGDLGFEVIVINRAIDAALQEMEQVAQCILLDFPVANIALLVQRIADLVTDNLGGPVKDASAMLARWSETSTQLRTSLHTSLLPIGCINIGLSRHRALLFKVSSLPAFSCLSVFARARACVVHLLYPQKRRISFAQSLLYLADL